MTPSMDTNLQHSRLPVIEHLSHTDSEAANHLDLSEAPEVAVPRHPLGVRPSGNFYSAESNDRDTIGSFSILPDELILHLLEHFPAEDLLSVGLTCKALYAFSRTDELWKAIFLQNPPEDFTWRGTWRSTCLDISANLPSLSCRNLFSDTLYRPFQCTHISLSSYVQNIPQKNLIHHFHDLTQEDFIAHWTDTPFILTAPVKQWPVYKQWSSKALLSEHGNTLFRAEAVDWPLHKYISYMNNSSDESPLYLFDRSFVEKMNLTVSISSSPDPNADYSLPACFGEDLFALLGSQRPDSRWLIIGPERSGSTFHKDPNATSAWNAVLTGSKYWIMFPGSAAYPPPPGVFVSADQSEVTSPLSIAEWLLTFHAEARRTKGCMEGICGEGEVLHVPSGWWHLVVNLSPAIAITQNFISRAHLVAALDFLKNKRDQISGFRPDVTDPYELFVGKLRGAHPDLLEEALSKLDREMGQKKRKWDEVIKGAEEESSAGGFSFGFGDADDEDIP